MKSTVLPPRTAYRADISIINQKKKKKKKKKKLAKPYTAVNGIEPTRVLPAVSAPLAFVCPFI